MAEETLGKRIRQMLQERGMTQAELARLVGVKQQTVSYIVADKGAESSRYATRIAEVLGVNPVWLQHGGANKLNPIVRIEMSGVEVALARVPLLSERDVIQLAETGRVPSEHQGRNLMTDARTGPRCFAIELEGESMAPQFIAGDKVVIDPDIRPEPGDFVCATVNGAITFRKYRERSRNGDHLFELVPMNQDWPIIRSEEGAEVVGVMTEHRTYRRKK